MSSAASRAAMASAALCGFAALSSSSAFVPTGVQTSSTPQQLLRGEKALRVQLDAAASSGASSSALLCATGATAVASVLAAASRSATARKTVRATQVCAFENELGATAPFKYWDPLGMSNDGDKEAFERRRLAEIKNGRVAMAACIGWIAPEYFRWEGYVSPSKGIKFADIPNGMAALYKLPAEGWAQMGVFVSFLELHPMRQQKGRAPGDFPGFGWLGHPGAGHIEDPAKKERALNSEINNGRLAMVAITGMVFQNAVTGTTGPEMWGLGAFESELGATAPFKYWDPLGMSKDGDKDAFERRRLAEIKNGRVAMAACIGWIVPEYVRWEGYVSPSKGIKFADIPNGMAALYKLPAEGWAQMGVFVSFLELHPMRQQKDRAPGDFPGFGWLGHPGAGHIEDPAKKERALNSEINNGRLAMVAITGMVFQNAVTGTTGPEMWGFGAFENELGATAPFKYWDPFGMAADGDKEAFNRRRLAEIKNGRVAMAACIGWIAPEYFRWEGFISPSKGLKFADIPNGMAALYKIPSEGWAQMGVFVSFLELFPMRQRKDRAPGDFPGFGWLGHPGAGHIEDPAKKERALNAEINNGRLAMVAITGMVFQNSITGTTGPEMWGL